MPFPRPKYSVCATLFNNANRLEETLNRLMKALKGKNFEIVVVDSYSTDGSFEILKKYAQKYGVIKILREKCSRGRGRQIAFEHAKGEIIIFVDMDTWYKPNKLSKLLKGWERSEYRHLVLITLSPLWICPRSIVREIGGWKDFNAADDIDFMTRIYIHNKGIFCPISLGLNEPVKEQQISFLGVKITLFGRERRYSKSLFSFIRRKWKDTIDSYNACDYTFRKLILKHRYFGANFIATFLYASLLVFSKILTFCLKKPVSRADENLPNNYWVNYQMIKSMVDPKVFGLKRERDPFSIWKKEDLLFISQFYPEILSRKKK